MGKERTDIDPGRLRLAFKLLGLGLNEVARASGVSSATISLFLSGKRTPSQTLAVRIVEGLEIAFRHKHGRLDTSFFTRAARQQELPDQLKAVE